ncbi:hypothetical protein STENM36S_08712 [Streptomyces tendae]
MISRRKVAGWAVLSLVPAMFVTLAVLAGQLAEPAVAVVIAAFLAVATYTGIRLLSSEEGRRG